MPGRVQVSLMSRELALKLTQTLAEGSTCSRSRLSRVIITATSSPTSTITSSPCGVGMTSLTVPSNLLSAEESGSLLDRMMLRASRVMMASPSGASGGAKMVSGDHSRLTFLCSFSGSGSTLPRKKLRIPTNWAVKELEGFRRTSSTVPCCCICPRSITATLLASAMASS